MQHLQLDETRLRVSFSVIANLGTLQHRQGGQAVFQQPVGGWLACQQCGPHLLQGGHWPKLGADGLDAGPQVA